MFKLGPNPYGLTCTLGLQGSSKAPRDLHWYVGLAEQIKASCIEFHFAHLAGLCEDELDPLADRLRASPTPCAWFPADEAITPSFDSSGVSRTIRL